MQRSLTRWLALVVFVSLMLTRGAMAPIQSASAAGGMFVPETQHTLSGPLRAAWEAGGGVWVFGYPISEPFVWSTSDSEVVLAQYFERARLEYHPAFKGTSYAVLGGLLGNDLAVNRLAEPDFRGVASAPDANCVYIAATRHSLCDAFERWWNDEGGLPIFGYPISEPFQEDGYLVQYFERARFEYHHEYAGTLWEVELGQLGVTDAAQRGLLDTPAFAGARAPTVTTRVDTTLLSDPASGDVTVTLPAGTTVSIMAGPSFDWYYVSAVAGAGWTPFSNLAWSTLADARQASQYTLASLSGDLAGLVATADRSATVAVYDPMLGRMYSGGHSGPIAAASLAKLLLLAIALQQAERSGVSIADVERATLANMIVYSDNDSANEIWNDIGLDVGALTFLSDNQLAGFAVPDPFDWGAISAEAPAWATFLGLLGSGQLLNADDTAFALGLLQGVVDEQRWGVLTPGAERLSIGKNGWYLDEDDVFDWRINSAGFMDSSAGPLGIAPLVVVVLTRYQGELGMDWGVSFAGSVADDVVSQDSQRWWAAQVASLSGLAGDVGLVRDQHHATLAAIDYPGQTPLRPRPNPGYAVRR